MISSNISLSSVGFFVRCSFFFFGKNLFSRREGGSWEKMSREKRDEISQNSPKGANKVSLRLLGHTLLSKTPLEAMMHHANYAVIIIK